jgi:carboxyl-terminal processing protease
LPRRSSRRPPVKFFPAWAAVALVSLLIAAVAQTPQKKYKSLTNQQYLEILNQVQKDIKENYFDPAIGGFDLDERFEESRREIAAAKSGDEALLSVAGAVAALKDSHTRFIPPTRPYGVEYGWRIQAIGAAGCFVQAVKPGSDAESKGLKPGDQVLAINGVLLSRDSLNLIEYAYRVVPQSGLRLKVRSPNGKERDLLVMSQVVPGQPVVSRADVLDYLRHPHREEQRSRYSSIGKRVLVWKLPDFAFDPSTVDDLVNKTLPYDGLVLDLRGNPGGFEDTGKKMIAGFVDHDTKIFDHKDRKESRPVVVKSRGSKAYKGKLFILIDSKSFSAAEIFARVMQIEKRGTVLGDQSSGGVAEARNFVHAVQLDAAMVSQWSSSISIADLIMTDGKSLEKVGVTPDERILPGPADLAAGRDPALSRAIELAGGNVTPEEAGKIFPQEWPKKLTMEWN